MSELNKTSKIDQAMKSMKKQEESIKRWKKHLAASKFRRAARKATNLN
jgi:hypothetical protein